MADVRIGQRGFDQKGKWDRHILGSSGKQSLIMHEKRKEGQLSARKGQVRVFTSSGRH